MENAVKFKSKNGVYLIYDDKFKETIMSLRMIFPLRKETVTLANIMAELFSDRLVSAPTKSKMLEVSDNLYGARIHSRTFSVGKFQTIEIYIFGINEEFVEENLHQQYYSLLVEMLKEPLISDKTLKEAKKNVRQTLLRLEETPAHKALLEAFRNAGKEQLFGINVYGYLEEIDDISIEDISLFHQACVNIFPKEIYLTGKIEDTSFIDQKLFQNFNETAMHQTRIQKETIIETYKGNQSELILVYETEIHPNHALYYAYLLMLAILGQSPNSLLFQNIREKNSLCYSIYASQLIFDGLFYIGTSVNFENEETVLSLIEEQFRIIQSGEFDLDSAKQYLINRLSGTTENSRQLLEFHVRNHRMNLEDSIESLIQNFEKVSKEEVIQSIGTIKDHLTYIYRGENDEAN